MSDTTVVLPADSAPVRFKALDAVLERVTDRFNPILVKEVRQVLRGNQFRFAFAAVLIGLTVATVAVILESSFRGEGQGRDLFQGVFACLGFALFGLLPFSAFSSMGGEWEENTFDLLVLSNLRPGHVVRGKLVSAVVQALLYLLTFSPFLACSFLMQGVELSVIFLVLGTSFLWSVALSMLAVSLSTLSRVRLVRVLLMAMLAMGLFGSFGMAMEVCDEWLSRPPDFGDDDVVIGTIVFLLMTLSSCAVLYCLACNQLAHPEENRSTNLRVTFSVILALGVGLLTYLMNWQPDSEGLIGSCIMALFFVVLMPSVLFVSEPNELGRRVAARVPRRSTMAFLALPWLPGGGRGVIYFLLHLGFLVILCPVFALIYEDGMRGSVWDDGLFAFYGLCLYVTGYLLWPSGFLSRFLHRLPARMAARLGVPLLALTLFLLPGLLAFLIDQNDVSSFNHPGNPGRFVMENWEGFHLAGYWLVLLAFAGLGLLINLPRVFRSYFEVDKAQRMRALQEAAAEGGQSGGGDLGGSVE